MREIKFRAYHKEQKRRFDVWGLGKDFITEDTFDGVNPGTNAFCGDDLNFIQVIATKGVKDKNGVDIYEGDIVKCFLGIEQVGALDTIDFNQGSFRLRTRMVTLHEWNQMPDDTYGSELEVIGNIYQHHEFLK